MTQLKSNEIKQTREELLERQGNLCAILKLPLKEIDAALDHQHKESPFFKKGEVRGVLHKQANSLEGQMLGKFKRSGLADKIEFSEYLRNLADYLETNNNYCLLHPLARPKLYLMKSSYNSLVRLCTIAGIKCPQYPKSRKLTNKLKELYDKFEITPKYY